ncbi:MAG: 1-acyl-sn-glycerol-3-phosphate acyltransferase [bacterium]|nr:MAG: 1-acyl-sn-glycerol-3-phosphate acyltransferase [bacterium]
MATLISVFRWFFIAVSTILFGSLVATTGSYRFAILWGKALLFFSGAALSVKGTIKGEENYIIVANHSSFIDIPALLAALPVKLSWLVKKSLFLIPFLSSAMKKLGSVSVDRTDTRSKASSILRIIKETKNGKNFVIFPEGTRKGSDFKEGSFLIAKKSKVKILPVRIEGSADILSPKSFTFHPGKINVIIYEPMDYSDDIKNRIVEILK